MRFGLNLLVATVVILLTTTTAGLAAVAPRAHSAFIYVQVGSFSVTLDTKTATKVIAGVANPAGAQHPRSGVLVVCPATVPNGPLSLLHIGFPGVGLTPVNGHYKFRRLYIERHARLVTLGTGAISSAGAVVVRITGTARSAKLITGTISVNAAGCALPSSTYKAKFFGPLSA